MLQGTGKSYWQEVFANGTDPLPQAGTRGELGNKKKFCCGYVKITAPALQITFITKNLYAIISQLGQHLQP